jgi:anti-sigma regulatory factor (Ser/Thr protein kinase)
MTSKSSRLLAQERVSLLFAGVEPPEQTRAIPVADVSQVGEARRAVGALGAQLSFDETAAGRVAIIVTELATNVARHGGGGHLLVRAIAGRTGLEIIAIDKGPGLGDVERAMRDGFSTGGTAGHGLGAVRRMSDVFDLFTAHGGGTAVVSRMLNLRPGGPTSAPGLDVGSVNVAAPGERLSGDGCHQMRGERGPSFVLVDGLGHGPSAHDAARCAVEVCRTNEGGSPTELMTLMHAALRSTRGAAVAVAEIDDAGQRLRFVGVGNIACSVTTNTGTRSIASMAGIVGHEMRRINEFTVPFENGATLLAHSDGINTRWRVDQYPGIRPRHPALLAALMYRDHLRGRDDASVLVARRSIAV